VGAVSVGSDVTALTELDRLKDDFIRVIAHELKTPITVLKGYASVLGETLGPTLSGEHRRMLEAIGRNTDRLGRLLAELLDAQQIELGRLEIVKERTELASLIEEVAVQIASRSPRHRVRVVSAEPVVVIADGERLREVMRILLDNAVRYSPAGGDVDVALTVVDRAAQVTVRDQGVGIPRDRQARIFERFYRAHTGTPHDFGGTGLGLYVAKTIVSRHGGTLTFESDEGQGSAFTLRLPLEVADARA
jgi:signal transduction histidine kinase